MRTGVIVKYSDTIGTGIIKANTPQPQPQLFFHHLDVAAARGDIHEGDKVSFNTVYGSRGMQAIEIVKS